jgi:hypothetical protein
MRLHNRAIIALALFCTLTLSCASLSLPAGDGTIYRSAEKARTALTALQTLRYHGMNQVATAYLNGRISKERLMEINAVDEKFRAAWAKASDLVSLWLTAAKPFGLNEAMAEVETLGGEVEKRTREVE